jgi:hypothetical protein
MNMKKGLSGAILTQGPSRTMWKYCKDSHAQASVCKYLYPVTPFVYFQHDDKYVMELLQEPRLSSSKDVELILGQIVQLLFKMVWCLPPIYRQCGGDNWMNWRVQLRHFCNLHGCEIEAHLSKFFTSAFDDMVFMVHGDPTLANVLMRDAGNIVLCDPIPLSPKIPAHWCVDVGKVLQSAIGWERAIMGLEYDRRQCVASVLDVMGVNPMEQARCWFWCAIHCIRIIPYARRHAHSEALNFALRWSRHILEELLRFEVNPKCITSSILTAL